MSSQPESSSSSTSAITSSDPVVAMDEKAAFMLGLRYLRGMNIEQSFEKAAVHLTIAANAGNSAAKFLVAEMIEEGNGIEQNFARALQLYDESAALGYGKAFLRVGYCYRAG